jgi:predicted TIM-barrel fold metal-dependent hydrolase
MTVITKATEPYSPGIDHWFVDVDSHVSEAPDIWTDRLGKKWGDQAPHLEFDPARGIERWLVGGSLISGVAKHAYAGWHEPFPSHPRTIEEADPGAFDPVARLAYLDRNGIRAQVVYPNILGFHLWAFLKMQPGLGLDCVRAFNDWQIDYLAAPAPDRIIPLMALPIWDVEESAVELERCAKRGYRGISLGANLENVGLDPLRSGSYDAILARAQDLELSINFHSGFFDQTEEQIGTVMTGAVKDTRDIVLSSLVGVLRGVTAIGEVIMSGLCDRYPRLRFASIESGWGPIPFALDFLDWQFQNMGGPAQHPGLLLPSDYFRRQVYTSCWFEPHVGRTVDLYPDNVMFGTDFPHPTSLSPGPVSIALTPQATIDANLGGLEEGLLKKVLLTNAAKLYGISL